MHPEDTVDILLTPEEAAEKLGVGVKTVWRWILEGTLKDIQTELGPRIKLSVFQHFHEVYKLCQRSIYKQTSL